MDLAGIKAATASVIAQVPGIEGFIEGVRQSLTASVKDVVGDAMAGVADGVSQIVALGLAVDGATVTVVFDPIVIRAVFTVSMPLKPVR